MTCSGNVNSYLPIALTALTEWRDQWVDQYLPFLLPFPLPSSFLCFSFAKAHRPVDRPPQYPLLRPHYPLLRRKCGKIEKDALFAHSLIFEFNYIMLAGLAQLLNGQKQMYRRWQPPVVRCLVVRLSPESWPTDRQWNFVWVFSGLKTQLSPEKCNIISP